MKPAELSSTMLVALKNSSDGTLIEKGAFLEPGEKYQSLISLALQKANQSI